ncbi:Hypothetical_protein [Hexamita inflata]|uniref:Hypothetical_protein n=1 Tax=Hexamita inflata TaxID=28002 RepID=A0AA86PII9_9EUKA|nr:Hypothetical protein HINF_LOCUS27814 [Hexamita inflata]
MYFGKLKLEMQVELKTNGYCVQAELYNYDSIQTRMYVQNNQKTIQQVDKVFHVKTLANISKFRYTCAEINCIQISAQNQYIFEYDMYLFTQRFVITEVKDKRNYPKYICLYCKSQVKVDLDHFSLFLQKWVVKCNHHELLQCKHKQSRTKIITNWSGQLNFNCIKVYSSSKSNTIMDSTSYIISSSFYIILCTRYPFPCTAANSVIQFVLIFGLTTFQSLYFRSINSYNNQDQIYSYMERQCIFIIQNFNICLNFQQSLTFRILYLQEENADVSIYECTSLTTLILFYSIYITYAGSKFSSIHINLLIILFINYLNLFTGNFLELFWLEPFRVTDCTYPLSFSLHSSELRYLLEFLVGTIIFQFIKVGQYSRNWN